MRLPQLSELATSKDNTEVFTGYNHNLRNSVGEWYDQKNMTTDFYPVASPRNKRSIQSLIKDTQIPFDSSGSDAEGRAILRNIFLRGCYGLAYTDKKIISLQKITDENNVSIGFWFAENGKLSSINYMYPLQVFYDIEFEYSIMFVTDDRVTHQYTIKGIDSKKINANLGDTLKIVLFDSKGNDGYCGGTVYEIGDDYITIESDIAFLMYNNSGPNAMIINNTKKKIIEEKFSYFDAENSLLRNLVRMGANICVFPDGVVYETANKDADVPVFKIAAETSLNDVLLSTVIKSNQDNHYMNIREYSNENGFRVSGNGVQEYLSENGLWVDVKTQIKISTLTKDNVFDDFNVNDSITFIFAYDGSAYDGSGYEILINNFEQQKEFSAKIIEKGSEIVNGFELDFIIINGYVYDSYSKTAYVNASSFEIGKDLFPEKRNFGAIINRKMPNLSLVCESQNRIWGGSSDGHEIYASALGNPHNFYDYSGVATDSYAVNVGTDGEFTGCINYLGKPLFFKENALHYISGSYPSNNGSIDGMSYAVTTTTDFKGVEKGSENSLAIIDNILYYKSSAGIVAYDGSVTTVISDALGKEKYKNAVAGVCNNKYYVSMQDKQGVYHLFVYDTALGTWCREDNTEVLQFLKINNELLFIEAAENNIYCVNDENITNSNLYSEEDDFDWFCETGNFGYSYPNNKYLSRLQVRMQIKDGAKATIYIQYNSDGIWHRKGEMSGKGIRTHLVPIVPIRCDHMKIKIAGNGDVKIYSIAKIFEEGGDV